MGYAGDISAREAWVVLKTHPDSELVDVRTQAEWAFVGVPDLSEMGKKPVFLQWQSFPDGRRNPNFETDLQAQLTGMSKSNDVRLLFLCRSGARSQSAAAALSRLGYSNCFNISDGFEGQMDPARHRGALEGWKKEGLPWFQS